MTRIQYILRNRDKNKVEINKRYIQVIVMANSILVGETHTPPDKTHKIPRTTNHSHYRTEPDQARAVEYRIANKQKALTSLD